MLELVVATTGALVVSALTTGVVRTYAQSRSLLDIPTPRSSHGVPTPRGGGLAIALGFFLSVTPAFFYADFSPSFALPLLGAGVVALTGWIDDHGHIAVSWRLSVHVLAATWAVYWLGGLEGIALGGRSIHIGWAGPVLAVLGVAWLTNLFNFMDGIDGLAASQAVTAGIAGGALLAISGTSALAFACFVLAGAVAGFLVWNWPPAKIFMGDVGSGFIGFTLGVIALASEIAGAVPALVWVILLSLFIGDASFTLVKRMLVGERWYEAHRSHAYQRLTDLGWSHKQVTLLALAINVLVLWPLAWLAWRWPVAAPYIATVVMLAVWLGWKITQSRHRIRFGGTEVTN